MHQNTGSMNSLPFITLSFSQQRTTQKADAVMSVYGGSKPIGGSQLESNSKVLADSARSQAPSNDTSSQYRTVNGGNGGAPTGGGTGSYGAHGVSKL